MSFHDVRLPVNIEKGVSGGPSFNTQIAALSSGFEQRNGNWSRAKLEWNIGYGMQTKQDFAEVQSFFYARRGRLFSFRFKDWSDYQVATGLIGEGDDSTTKFQMVKVYSDAGGSYTRVIQKPVDGTVLVYIDTVLQTEDSDYTVDYSTGVITFSSAPADGEVITATFDFDVPARFDTDRFDLTLENFNAGEIPNLPIVEDLLQLADLS